MLRASLQPVFNRLCEKCEQIFDEVAAIPSQGGPRAPSGRRVPFYTVQTLFLSAANGCHLCNLIVSELDPRNFQFSLENALENPQAAQYQIVAAIPSDIWMGDDDGNTDTPLVTLEEALVRPRCLNRVALCHLNFKEIGQSSVPRQLPLFTGSFETYSVISQWIQTCEADHPDCRTTQPQRQLPTRLLDIGHLQNRPLIRLRESNNLPQNTRYATLSHCWGAYPAFKLTLHGYEQFVNGVAFDRLPNTFRDAIIISRWIGIRYMWIDSMCIIQDSRADWERESLLMSDIYSGSFLNIGANAVPGQDGGLFHARNPLRGTPLVANLTWNPRGIVRRPVAFFPKALGRGQLDHAQLSKRAWVAQERILAARTVHFLPHKILWECRCLVACDSDPDGTFVSGSDRVRERIGRLATLTENDRDPRHLRWKCLEKWHQAVSIYTVGNLTFQTDKLVAIAGIAKRIQSLWGDLNVRYLAGLWSYELEQSLLWSVYPPDLRQADIDAPSWSWASVQGHVMTYSFNSVQSMSLLATVRDADTTPRGDPFGRVSGGYIRITGPMCAVTMDQQLDRRTAPTVQGVHADVDTPQLWWEATAIEFRELHFDKWPVGATPGERLFLLAIGIGKEFAGKDMYGILLKRLGQGGRGSQPYTYIRIGFWSMTNPADPAWDGFPDAGYAFRGTNYYSMIWTAFDEMNLDVTEYEMEDGERGQYTIYIV